MRKLPFHIRFLNLFSLRLIIIIPLMSILLLGSLAIYIQVHFFVEKYSDKVIRKNQAHIKDKIEEQLDNYFKIPEYINVLNASLARNGQLDINNGEKLGKILLDEVISHSTVDYAYFANEKGGIVSSGFYKDTYRISLTDNLTYGDFQVYQVDENGNQIEFIKSISNFDPRTRSWYTQANDEDKAYWTEVYSGAQEPILGISTSYPLFSSTGEKVGVFGTDVLLSQISTFLQDINSRIHGMVYLFESNGLMIATSTDESVFNLKDGVETRLSMSESQNEVVREGYKLLESVISDSDKKNSSIHEKINVLGYEYYFDINRHTYNDQVIWYTLSVIPKNDFLGDIDLLFMNFKILFLAVLFIIIVISLLIAKWIVMPIITLNNEVSQIQNHNWGGQIDTYRDDELGDLTRSFNTMSLKLYTYFNKLSRKQKELEYMNANLEKIVEERTKELELLSVTDGLTSIFNRRYLIEMLEKNIEACKKKNEKLSIIIFDIDHFKRINDTYGHVQGDVTLIAVSHYLKDAIRERDILGRYGGEEFMVILPDTNLQESFNLAEIYRENIGRQSIGEDNIHITISGGIAEYNNESLMEFINKADMNLYKAKETGRNKCEK